MVRYLLDHPCFQQHSLKLYHRFSCRSSVEQKNLIVQIVLHLEEVVQGHGDVVHEFGQAVELLRGFIFL